jgi:hypothetical protein
MKALTRDSKGSSAMWLKQNKLDELWSHTDMRTGGYASSGWELQMDSVVYGKGIDQFNAYLCPYVVESNINILMRTEIKIAREYPPGSCEYDAIDAHEYKHYQVNRYVLEQAVERLRIDLPAIIRDLEMEGYVGRSKFEERAEVIKVALQDVIQIYVRDQIRKEMEELNKQVDTPAEYERVSKLLQICKIKENMKRSGAMRVQRQKGLDQNAPAQK